MITQQILKDTLYYNKDTGIFTWKIKKSGINIGDEAGCLDKNTGYIKIRINNKLYYGHRLAWLYETGQWPKEQIDHINHKRDDNRIENLREVTNAQNAYNQSIRPSNKSGFKGVTFNKIKKLWMAQIMVNYKNIQLGHFETKELAFEEYKKAAIHYFKEYASIK